MRCDTSAPQTKKMSIQHVQTLSSIPAMEESGHCTAMQCLSSLPLRILWLFSWKQFGLADKQSPRFNHYSVNALPNSVAPVPDEVGAMQKSTQKGGL